MKNIAKRLGTKTPPFFMTIVRLSAVVAAAGAAIMALPSDITKYIPYADAASSYMIVAGIIVAVIAKLPDEKQ